MSGATPTEPEEALARQLGSIPLPNGDLGLERALVAYRSSRAGRRPRRRLVRGVAALSVAGLAMSGGMAAAYAASLPLPVQRVAHRWLSPLGVPAPHHREIVIGRARREPVVRPSTHYVSTDPTLVSQPGPVVFGDPLSLTATATAPETRLVLLSFERGGWHVQATATAHHDLQVLFLIRPRADSRYAVAEPALGRRSRPMTVVVQPRLTWTVHRSARGFDVRVHVDGATSGEQVRLVRATVHGVRLVATARIDRSGAALLVVGRPPANARYLLEVEATRSHGAANASLSLTARGGRAG